MTRLRVLLFAAALLTAACGATTVSSSPVKSVSNSGNVRVEAGANAGTNVAAGPEDVQAPRNPTARKGLAGVAPVQQSQAPGPNPMIPTTPGDRCTNGMLGCMPPQ